MKKESKDFVSIDNNNLSVPCDAPVDSCNSVEQTMKDGGFCKQSYPAEYPYKTKNLYYKRIESKVKCETNGNIQLNIWETQFVDMPVRYEIQIVAEIGGFWWDIKAYSLSVDDIKVRLGFLHLSLRAMIESIIPIS